MTFQPGKSGNPGGRSSEKVFADAIRAAVNVECPVKKRKRLLNIADKIVDLAEVGEPWACNIVADRLDGKPAQAVDMDIAIGPNEAFIELMRRVSAGDFAKPIQVIDGSVDNGMAALKGQPAAVRNGGTGGHTNTGTTNGTGGHRNKRSRGDKGSA